MTKSRPSTKVNSLGDSWEDAGHWDSMEDDELSSEAALLRELDDIYHNPESDCSILYVQGTPHSVEIENHWLKLKVFLQMFCLLVCWNLHAAAMFHRHGVP